MNKAKVAIPLSVAVIAIGWFAFATREKSGMSMHVSPDVMNQAESDDLEVQALAADGSVPATVGSHDLADSGADRESASARSWHVSPEVMEALILQELASLADSGISSVVSWNCTQTLCEVRVISNRSLSALVGPNSPFSREFSGEPYSAIIRARSKIIAPGTWDRTILLASNGNAVENIAGEWRQAVEMSRRSADVLLENFLPGSSPLSLGTTIDGVRLSGQNVCSHDCPRDMRRVIYLNVPNGRTCAQINGTEWTTTSLSDSAARSGSGEVQERTFCLPNLLIEY